MSPKRKSVQRRMKRSKTRSVRRMKRSARRSTRRSARRSRRSARRSVRRSRRSARRSVRRSSSVKRGGSPKRRQSCSMNPDSRHCRIKCWYNMPKMSGGAMRKQKKSSMKRKSVRKTRRSRPKDGRRTGSGSKVRIPITHRGALEGYHVNDLVKDKRKMLDWYVKKDGYSTIIKRLNVLAIYNKNRDPKMSKKVKNDISYLQKKYRM